MTIRVRCRHTYAGGFSLDAQFELHDRIGALFGPSGSGKTTIVSMLAGVLRPDDGVISFDDEVWFDRGRRTWARPENRGVGVVFQDHRLFPHLSVRANLRYGLKHGARSTKTSGAGRAISFENVVEILELGALLDRQPLTLSGGEQRRVAIGRALLRSPRLLLLDEPLTGLDDALSRRVISYIDRLTQALDVPTLLITHSQSLVRRFAGEVVVLESGRVIGAGPTIETLDEATLRSMSNHPGPVNVLRIENVLMVDDHAIGKIGEQSIYLPRAAWTGSETAFVEVDPTDIIIAIGEAHDLSTRNRLNGEVIDRAHLSDRECWFVAVDVGAGQIIWAEVTSETIRELKLEKGARVGCLIKAMAMKPL